MKGFSMPSYPTGANPIPGGNISFGLIDAAAKNASVPFPVRDAAIEDITDALVDDLRDAVGELSNAAVYKTNREFSEELSISFVQPLDEAMSSVVNRLNFTFENIEGVKVPVSIPAPDIAYFVGAAVIRPDSTTIVGTPTPAQVLFRSITRMIAFLNVSMAPADPSFRLTEAYATTRTSGTRGSRKNGRVVYAEEPQAGIIPSGAPDTSPTAGQQ
jgi:hypothetical protein